MSVIELLNGLAVFLQKDLNRPNATGYVVRSLLKDCHQFGQFTTKIIKNVLLVDNDLNEINVLVYFTASPNAPIRDCYYVKIKISFYYALNLC